MDSPMNTRNPDYTRRRHAIRLFIGYEQNAQDLVAKFVSMKRQHNFQSAVDLFSWLLKVADVAEKPRRLPKKPVNEKDVLKIHHQKQKVSSRKKMRRRKQTESLKNIQEK